MSNTQPTQADIKAIGAALLRDAEAYYAARDGGPAEGKAIRSWTLDFLSQVLTRSVYVDDTRTQGRVVAMTCKMLRDEGASVETVPALARAETLVARLRVGGLA